MVNKLFRRGSPWALGAVEDRAVPPPVEPVPLTPVAQPMFPTTNVGVPIVSPRNALAIADVYAAVRCLSDAAASVPLIPYRKTADGRTRHEGPLSDLLRRPALGVLPAEVLNAGDGRSAA
ncbi:MAG: hypothetical protein WKF96_24065, partial [Solirubrobacteraceae bacterium]